MFAAWREFRRGKRKKKDVATFELNLEDNIFELHRQLAVGAWRNDSYNVFCVSDPKPRIIHKASVRDRVLFQAVGRKLYNTFDLSFIFDSYSSRTDGGTHKAVKRLEIFERKVSANFRKNGYVLKCDIRKFFDSIDHKILLEIISQRIKDEKLFALISQIVFSFATDRGKGLPLGNVTSQLFANIYLNELDQFVKNKLKARYYVRYCDDFVLADESLNVLRVWVEAIKHFCKNRLSLDLHKRKIIFRKIHQGADFLGYVVLPHYKVLRTKTKKRILAKLACSRSDFAENKITKEKFWQLAQSYLGILSHCKGQKTEEKIAIILKGK